MTRIDAKVAVPADPDTVWREFGSFQGVGEWHPWLESVQGEGETPGSIRVATTGEDQPQVERLLEVDPVRHFYRYRIESTPLPVRDYVGELAVRDRGDGTSTVRWASTFELTSEAADPDSMVGEFLRAGLRSIQHAFD